MTRGFGVENLPLGAFAEPGGEPGGIAVRFEDDCVAVRPLAAAGLLDDAGLPRSVLQADNLDPLLAAGRASGAALREVVAGLLRDGRADRARRPLGGVRLLLAFTVGDYVDFFASLEHATNIGRLFRPDGQALPAAWRHLPIAYHGRAGTVVVSGTPVRRPAGFRPGDGTPSFGPSRALDFELELGVVAGGPATAVGEPLGIDDVAERIFGVVLVNDWSARDIQRFEYVPLGPFLGKSFATSISAWVVGLDALDRARVPPLTQAPPPAAHLRPADPWALELDLEVELGGERISAGNARGLYWTFQQQLAHAASNGAAIRPGDLFASGTVSGAQRGSEGCLLELTRNGAEPLVLASGAERSFLADGDRVTLRAQTADGTVALGDVTGEVVQNEREGAPGALSQHD
jgi:fumarylacetoacetase